MKANSGAKIGGMKATLAIKSTSKSKIENNIFQILCLFFFQLHNVMHMWVCKSSFSITTETIIFRKRGNPTKIEKEDSASGTIAMGTSMFVRPTVS